MCLPYTHTNACIEVLTPRICIRRWGFKEVIKINEVTRVGSNRTGCPCKKRERHQGFVCTEERPFGDRGKVRAKERGLRRNSPCRHLDLELPVSRVVSK